MCSCLGVTMEAVASAYGVLEDSEQDYDPQARQFMKSLFKCNYKSTSASTATNGQLSTYHRIPCVADMHTLGSVFHFSTTSGSTAIGKQNSSASKRHRSLVGTVLVGHRHGRRSSRDQLEAIRNLTLEKDPQSLCGLPHLMVLAAPIVSTTEMQSVIIAHQWHVECGPLITDTTNISQAGVLHAPSWRSVSDVWSSKRPIEEMRLQVFGISSVHGSPQHLSTVVKLFQDRADASDGQPRRVVHRLCPNNETGSYPLPPSYVHDVNLYNKFPQNRGAEMHRKANTYVILTHKGHSMDWHVHPNGSAVVYAVVVGSKLWLMAPPTHHNMTLFQRWLKGGKGVTSFFPHELEHVVVTCAFAGQVLFVPACWVHAVHALEDSILFGWNVLVDEQLPTTLSALRVDWGTSVQDFRNVNMDFSEHELAHFLQFYVIDLKLQLKRTRTTASRERLLSILRAVLEHLFSMAQPSRASERTMASSMR
ncbi:hypothetical protein AB1Y20_021309 [Prymnesium parvum]|uniref:JmjC domain-containing protein n=1 Tax=Prymnesium parvum TaxID=97485 RepID=A0AB34JK89_PRYPA|mmetsp:Transcript_18973/g.47332  ORF Transcript_18973/g.47332 Transcript_18973/m.47332 type:complete len:478 (-) Transcript_18973:839-2272(-)